jgi:hypothetical protein
MLQKSTEFTNNLILSFTHPPNPSELPPISFCLMRHFPSKEDPTRPFVHELTVATVSDVKIKDMWYVENSD